MNLDERLSQALNELDKLIGKEYSRLKFTVDDTKEEVKLHAYCRACPKEIEVRLWYKHEEWPEHMMKDFFRDCLLHNKVHQRKIFLPKTFYGNKGRMMH